MAAEMGTRTKRVHPMVAVMVGVHIALLAAYTLPAQFVPTRVRYWSQAYSRVLFHQDWRLFAPDPPACGCSIEYRIAPEGGWSKLEDLHHHFIWRRMAANLCRFAEASPVREGIIHAPSVLSVSLGNMVPEPSGLRTQRVHREGCTGDDEFMVLRTTADPAR